MEKIDAILKKNISEKSFNLWLELKNKITNPCWDKLTSSTKKHHRKENGDVPSVAGHTYEMLYATDKIISMFEGIINKDVIFLSIVLHDCYKYGECKTCQHTEAKHGQITADKIKNAKKLFLQVLTESETDALEQAVRYHDGRFSMIAKQDNFDRTFFTPEVMFLHTLDMMGSRDLIKIKDYSRNIIYDFI